MIRRSTYTITVLVYFGVMVLLGGGCKKEPGEKKVTILSLEELRAKAEDGDADAQYSLGMIFEEGAGVEKDKKTAAQWYEKSATQGHAPARTELAILYSQGLGVEQDKQKGLALYLESAKQGDALAQFHLGVSYQTGWLGEKDDKKAVQWFSKAHEQGLLWATISLAQMYVKGEGVEKTPTRALDLYDQAEVDRDNWLPFGQEIIYATKELHEYIQKENLGSRKSLGAPISNVRISTYYRIGMDCKQNRNYTEAYQWLLVAGLEGQDVFKEKNELLNQMTVDQVAKAKKMAVAFLRKRDNEMDTFCFREKVQNSQILEYDLPESVWDEADMATVPPQTGAKVKDRWQFQAVQDERCLYLRFTYHEPLPEISRNMVGKLQMSEEYLGHLPSIEIMYPPEQMRDYEKQKTHVNHPGYPTLVRPYFGRPKPTIAIRCQFNLNYRYVDDDSPIRFIGSISFDPNDLERDCELIKFNLSSTISKYFPDSNIKIQEELHYWFHGNEEDGIHCAVSLDQHNGKRSGGHDEVHLGNYSNLIIYEESSFIIRVPLTQKMFYDGEIIPALMTKPLPQVSLRIRPYGTDKYSLYFPKKVVSGSGGE